MAVIWGWCLCIWQTPKLPKPALSGVFRASCHVMADVLPTAELLFLVVPLRISPILIQLLHSRSPSFFQSHLIPMVFLVRLRSVYIYIQYNPVCSFLNQFLVNCKSAGQSPCSHLLSAALPYPIPSPTSLACALKRLRCQSLSPQSLGNTKECSL